MSFLSQFDAFHEQASQITGLDDFGDRDYVEPLKLLLSDYDQHSRFSESGAMFAGGAIVGMLIARLFAFQGFKAHPQFAADPIDKPIIILGLPRTGSTSLHRLLAKDPGSQWLAPWLGNTPMPRPPRETWEQNPWYQFTVQGIEQFYQLNPDVRELHPMVPAEADECRYGMEPSLWSPGLAFMGRVPNYTEWVLRADPRPAYAYYKRVLGLIAGGDRRHWILKDPTTHLWATETMLEAFPDARIVYTHREPAGAMASIADLIYEARRCREVDLRRDDNGRFQLQLWSPAIERMEAALSRLDPARIAHVHIKQLQRDPVGTAEAIYTHFGLPVSEAARSAWQHHAATDARSGHGVHRYDPASVGFGAREVEAAIPGYWRHYQRRYGG